MGESTNYNSVCPILRVVEDIYSVISFRGILSLDLIQKKKVKDYGFPTCIKKKDIMGLRDSHRSL